MEKITGLLKENMILFVIGVIAILAIVVFVYLQYRKRKYNDYIAKTTDLDKKKVRVIYTPVELELSKLNKVVKNVDLLGTLNEWNEKWDEIKKDGVGKVSDKIFNIEDKIERNRFKGLDHEIAECNKMIDDLKQQAEDLHKEIVELSSVEDRIRERVTTLKAQFRNVKKTFFDNEAVLYYMKEELDERLNLVVNHIHDLDKTVGANEYTQAEVEIEEITKQVEVLKVLVERLPDMIMIVKQYIPRKIVTFEGMYKKNIDNGVYLDHLKLEEKTSDVSSMIETIIEKMKKLSFEDVEAEIEGISEYTENLFKTLEDETNNFYIFSEKYGSLKDAVNDTVNYVNELEVEVEKVKALYELADLDESEINEFKNLVNSLSDEFKALHTTPDEKSTYFDLLEKLNSISERAIILNDKIENSTSKIMNLRADEQRAREQIVEIQYLVDQSRKMMKKAKLPVVPSNYRVYVADAKDGITFIIDELNKAPIDVDALNKRVDTSLELAYKLYDHTKKIIKESMLSEVAIIYGNRYRSNISVVDKEITKAEELYYRGDYHDSLNTVVNVLEKTEPGIYSQLKKFFEKGEMINE